MNVKGWTVIVTGSASGIGAATARLLAQEGANVAINYSKSEAAARRVAEACEKLGAETLVCQADVSQDADCRRLADAAFERWGRLDGLVNNAGTTKFCAHGDLEGLSAEDFQRIYAVNLIGPYQMTRAAVPHMRKREEGGAIVNISSIAGVMGLGSSVAYAASKGALNTMTLSLARVLGPNIRFNTLCPGFVQGEWLREGMGEERYNATLKHMRDTTPLRRAGTPEDMAEAAVWLLAGSRNITGEIVMCDAGTHLSVAPLVAR